jgi:polar amino acid transport system permease protein
MQIELDFLTVVVEWHVWLEGLGWTVLLTAVSTVMGVALGTACAWMRSEGPPALRFVAGTYVEMIRNTPFIVQLFFIFFGLPSAGLRLSPETASIIAMTINLGAYSAEIVRAGVEATPRGQIEAAVSLALSRAQVFTRVILPPAFRNTWPALVSQIIIVMLGSAVCGQISVPDLNHSANLIQSINFRSFEAYIVATLLYLGLAIVLRRILNWAGPRLLFSR